MGKTYTGQGDDGFTGLLGGERVPKYDPRPEAYGTVDEAQAVMGMARAAAQDPRTQAILLDAQRDLYHIMAELAAATPQVAGRVDGLPQGGAEWLERAIDDLDEKLPPLRIFVVPGDSPASAALHLARTVVRRAERQVARLVHQGDVPNVELVRYLNRLSSLLFVLARWEDWQAGVEAPTQAQVGGKHAIRGGVDLTSPTDQAALKILEQAAENEIDTRRFYLDSMGRTQDPRGQEMYRFLADQEALHLRIVQAQIDALSEGKGWVASPEVQPGPFEDLLTLFRVPREKLREQIRSDDKALDALVIALEMEDNSFKVYRQAAMETDDPVGKQVLEYLAQAEQGHFDLVMLNYESLLHQQHWRGLPDAEGRTP